MFDDRNHNGENKIFTYQEVMDYFKNPAHKAVQPKTFTEWGTYRFFVAFDSDIKAGLPMNMVRFKKRPVVYTDDDLKDPDLILGYVSTGTKPPEKFEKEFYKVKDRRTAKLDIESWLYLKHYGEVRKSLCIEHLGYISPDEQDDIYDAEAKHWDRKRYSIRDSLENTLTILDEQTRTQTQDTEEE